MAKSSLSTQTGKLFIVIRKNKPLDIQKIKDYCCEYGKEYAFICHGKDIDPVTGLIIPVHYHIVMNAKDSKKRLSTHLNDLSGFFGFNDNNGIEIDKYRTYENALQYLLHKNNPEKTQHKANEIVTNIDRDELTTYLTCDSSVISFDYVYSICLSSHNIVDVIKGLGLSNYNKYRNTIWDIYLELHPRK